MPGGQASTNDHRQEAARPGHALLCRAQAKQLSALSACCTLVATSYGELILSVLHQFPSLHPFCLLVMLFVLVLPTRLLLLSIPLAVAALQALSDVNEVKISAVSLPITFFDV